MSLAKLSVPILPVSLPASQPLPVYPCRPYRGFGANRVSAAGLLDVSEDTDKKGKKYYKYELLVRSGETV